MDDYTGTDDQNWQNNDNTQYCGKLDPTSAFLYDIHKTNNIGHKIIGIVHVDGQLSAEYIQNKIHNIIRKYEFLSCIIEQRCVDGLFGNNTQKLWRYVGSNIHNHFEFIQDFTSIEDIIEHSLNTPFKEHIPGWKIQMIYNKSTDITYIICNINHNYGDGAVVTKLVGELFDNNTDKKDSCCPNIESKNHNGEKKRTSIINTIILFIKVLIIIIYRFIIAFTRHKQVRTNKINADTDALTYKYRRIHTWKLDDIKQIKNHYGVTVNDVIQGIIIKSLFLYDNRSADGGVDGGVDKTSYCSLSMFNLRDTKTELLSSSSSTYIKEHNKIGFIVIPNNISNDMGVDDLLHDIHDITTFYKTTPIVPITTSLIQTYYNIHQEGAINSVENLYSVCDFILSNYATKWSNKTIDGHRVTHISNTVSPHKIPKLYSIISYGDEITMNMSYIQGAMGGIQNIEIYRSCVMQAYKWFMEQT